MPEIVLPDLVFVVGWIAALGLLYVYDNTLHYAFVALASLLTFSVLGVHIDWGKGILKIDTTVRNALSDWAHGIERAMGEAFHETAVAWRLTWREIAAIPQDVLGMGHWLVHTFVPTYVHGVTDLIHPVVRDITKVERVTTTKVVRLTKTIEAKAAEAPAVAKRVAVAAVAATLPGVEVVPRIAWRDILHWKPNVNKRLTRLEALFGATAMGLAMANVLGIPSWKCLSKGPVGRMSRALCGLPSSFLNDLLGLIVDFAVIEDICQVIGWLSHGFTLIEKPLDEFVGVTEGALCHGDYSKPPTLTVPPLELTSTAFARLYL